MICLKRFVFAAKRIIFSLSNSPISLSSTSVVSIKSCSVIPSQIFFFLPEEASITLPVDFSLKIFALLSLVIDVNIRDRSRIQEISSLLSQLSTLTMKKLEGLFSLIDIFNSNSIKFSKLRIDSSLKE